GVALDRNFQRRPNKADFVYWIARAYDHMNMFGHDDGSPDQQTKSISSLFHGLHEPLSGPVAAQEGQPAEAGACQFMRMSGDVVTPNSLPMRCHREVPRANSVYLPRIPNDRYVDPMLSRPL